MKDKNSVPFWMIPLMGLFMVCLSMYSFLWAQNRIDQGGMYQFLAYASLIVAFGSMAYAIGIMIDRYRTGNKKLIHSTLVNPILSPQE